MKKQILFICCAVIAYCLSACNTAPQQAPLKEKNLPKHVILIGFDGLSAHCLNNGADMPTFRKMMAEGASTLENRSIDPAEALWDEPWVAVLFIGFVITMMLRELMGRKSAPLAGLAVGGLAAFIMQSLFAGIVIALIVVVIAMCIPTAVLEAGARRTAKMYGTDRRYRGKRGGGDDGFGGFGGFGGGGFGGGGFGGGMGGGAGSGGGGDAAGGGASGGW